MRRTMGVAGLGLAVILTAGLLVSGLGCGGKLTEAGAKETEGAWLHTTGQRIVIFQADGLMQAFGLDGSWTKAAIAIASGAFSYTITDSSQAGEVGVTKTGTYTLAGDNLQLVPTSEAATDWTRLPAGGPMDPGALGGWNAFGQILDLYVGGCFYYYDNTRRSIGICRVSGGTFSLQHKGADDPTLIGRTIQGTYELAGGNMTWTPGGRDPVVLNKVR